MVRGDRPCAADRASSCSPVPRSFAMSPTHSPPSPPTPRRCSGRRSDSAGRSKRTRMRFTPSASSGGEKGRRACVAPKQPLDLGCVKPRPAGCYCAAFQRHSRESPTSPCPLRPGGAEGKESGRGSAHQRRAGLRQPGAHRRLQGRPDLAQHARVVGVQPGALLAATAARRRSGRGRTAPGSASRSAGTASSRRAARPPAPAAGFPAGCRRRRQIEAGLVRQDHPGLDRHRPRRARQADRALMHRQIAAHAVAGAVVVIQPHLPQRAPGERVQMRRRQRRAETPAWQWRCGPASPASPAHATPAGGVVGAGPDRARDVGGAVEDTARRESIR